MTLFYFSDWWVDARTGHIYSYFPYTPDAFKALLFFDDISTIIYAAFRACAMLHFRFSALRAGGYMRRGEFIMGPAFVTP
jgi:hypothetical protein